MYEFFIKLLQFVMPVFVISTMLNVGLTQKPNALIRYYKGERQFFGRMLFTNFFLSPAIMIMLVIIGKNILATDILDMVALTLLSLTAGAPFLIKLTEFSKNDIALGASLLLLLVVGSAVITPLLMPLILPSLVIDSKVLAWSLAKSLILPVIIGMLFAKFIPKIVAKVQPWLGMVGQYSMYLVLGCIFVGYFPQMKEIIATGSIAIGIVYIIMMLLTGYFMGGKRGDADLKSIGALGSAQRNIAASMIIASQNFADSPKVLVLISLVSTVGIVILIMMSKYLFSTRDKDTNYTKKDNMVA